MPENAYIEVLSGNVAAHNSRNLGLKLRQVIAGRQFDRQPIDSDVGMTGQLAGVLDSVSLIDR